MNRILIGGVLAAFLITAAFAQPMTTSGPEHRAVDPTACVAGPCEPAPVRLPKGADPTMRPTPTN